jgi:hypothetical protein
MRTRMMAGGEVALIVAVFFLHGAWPVPDVNEPHYLCKAKHYWDATWCAGDFFLESADAHQVFYWTFGWLTRFFSLPAVAWIGRLATWTLLAVAWRRLSVSIVPWPLASVLTAALAVTFSGRLHVAGEWFVGGFEAKPISYALVFLGWAAVVRRQWSMGLVWLGLATAFHVIVGGWASVAAAGAWLSTGRRGQRRIGLAYASGWCDSTRPNVRAIFPGLMGWVVLAAAGGYPALTLNMGVDRATVAEANRIYVFERLGHHLLLTRMDWQLVALFAALAIVLAVASMWVVRTPRARRMRGIVAMTLIFWCVGAGMSLAAENWPDVAAGVLRYYWFRLADVAVAVGAAVAATLAIYRVNRERPTAAAGLLLVAILACSGHFGNHLVTRLQAPYPLADKPGKVVDYQDWRAICGWIAESGEIAPGARFLTPRTCQTFKWYTGHPEVVTWKDMPQDAVHLVEWMARLEEIHKSRSGDPEERWAKSLAEVGAAELTRLGRKYAAQYVLTENDPPVELERMVWNRSYVVYRLPD